MSQVLKEIGEVLESTREHKGLKLEDLAHTLKIRQRYLLALERGEPEELPVSAYIIGYLRSYANALGLDGDAVVMRFKEGDDAVEKELASLPEPHKKEMRPLPLVLMISLVAAAGLYVYWYHGNNEIHTKITAAVSNFKSNKKPVQTSGELAKQGGVLPASLNNSGVAPSANNVVAQGVVAVSDISKTVEQGAKIVLLAKGTTWVQVVTKSNDFLLEKKLHPGESYNIPARDDLVIRSGNPESIEVYVQGATKKALLGTLSTFNQPLSALNPASGEVPQE